MERAANTLLSTHTSKLGRVSLAGVLSNPFVCAWLTLASPMAAGRGSLNLGTALCKVSYS
jgi:hypothetical protein